MGTAIPTVNGVRSQSDLCSNLTLQNAWRRTHRTQEAQRWARRRRRQEDGVPRRAHEAPLGLHQEEQPPGPRQQAVLRPRQGDGQGLRLREDARLRHGQAHRPPPILSSRERPTVYSAFLYYKCKKKKKKKKKKKSTLR